MEDEKNRGRDVERIEAPEQKTNDRSSASKNGAVGQAESHADFDEGGTDYDENDPGLLLNVAQFYLKWSLKEGRYSAKKLAKNLETDTRAKPPVEIILAAAKALGYPIDGNMIEVRKKQKLVDSSLPHPETLQDRHKALKFTDELVKLDDFVCSLPDDSFIYLPTGDHWPAVSVNTIVAKVTIGLQKVTAAEWLRKNRAVRQITWDPNKPQLVEHQLIIKDSGWIDKPDTRVLNTYQPPKIVFGPSDEAAAGPWLDLIKKVFPDDWQHIVRFFAHRVQRPGEKINHALFLGGAPGIGKDTILEALRFAVGAWNVQEITPRDIIGNFKQFMRCVVLVVNEIHDLGEGKSGNRHSFYEAMKIYCAAPPATLLCEPKHVSKFPVINVCGVIMTSNYKTGGMYLPANDRRTYVAWSNIEQKDFSPEYWHQIWSWYQNGGLQHVANFLKAYDLSDFDSKAPPPKTAAFHAILASNRPVEESEMYAAIEVLGHPPALTIAMVAQATMSHDFALWLEDRRNSRIIPHRLEAVGYTCILNPDNEQGHWGYHQRKAEGAEIVKKRYRTAIYGKRDLFEQQRQAAAKALINKLEKQ
jgi:hypothetical protein